jgi:hypothetical protein
LQLANFIYQTKLKTSGSGSTDEASVNEGVLYLLSLVILVHNWEKKVEEEGGKGSMGFKKFIKNQPSFCLLPA